MAQAKKDTKEKQVKEAELLAEAVPAKEPEQKAETAAAKAGKRSAKSVREAAQKQIKEEKKATGENAQPAKPAMKPARSKLERSSKRYKKAAGLVDKSKMVPLAEALELACKSSTTKFDATIELHVNLGVDPRQADQNVRDTVALPAGTGKEIRVIAINDDTSAEKLFTKLDKSEIDFDVLIATPAMMPKLGKYARLLGPRGLMPNPKSGTVTQDVEAAVKEAKAGRVEYRVDQAGIIHLGIGKASFGADKLQQNAGAVLASIRAAKPASLKGIYIKSIFVSSTMGPSIKVEA